MVYKVIYFVKYKTFMNIWKTACEREEVAFMVVAATVRAAFRSQATGCLVLVGGGDFVQSL